MSTHHALRALAMVRTKLLEAGKALEGQTAAGISSTGNLHCVLSLPVRVHIHGAILQAMALLEQVEEELEDTLNPEAAIAEAVRVIGESQEMWQVIQHRMDRLNRGKVGPEEDR